MAGNCICDDEVCQEASNQEIIRRYYQGLVNLAQGHGKNEEVFKLELLMNQSGLKAEDRKVVPAANSVAKRTELPAAAMELPDGTIVTGKTTKLLGASAAVLLNALKTLAEIPDEIDLISPSAIEPIQRLKTEYLGGKNPRLHTDEVLIALSISAKDDENARRALEQLPKLFGCQVHTTVILSSVDTTSFKRLGVLLTCEARYENKSLYH